MIKIIGIIFLIICGNLYAQVPLYVPYAPGGMTDRIGRTIVGSETQYRIMNKPGGQGQIAISEMSRNPGPMIITTSAFYVTNPLLLKESITYDPNNLETIALLGDTIGILMCNKKINIRSVSDFVNYPSGLTFAVGMPGGAEHIVTESFLEKVGRNQHIIVTYPQSGGKYIPDLISGTIDCSFTNLATMLPYLNNDRLVPILTTQNSILTETVPTWKKSFGSEFTIHNSTAIVVDKRWSIEVKTKILSDLKEVLSSMEFKKTLESMGHTYSLVLGSAANDEVQRHNNILRNFLNRNKNIKFTE